MTVGGTVSLVGRAPEREALEAWLRAAAAGRAQLGLIEGEAGIGKTRLARALADIAPARSFVVFTAACDELDRGRPFGVLGDALGFFPAANAAAAAVPGMEYRLVDEVVERVERLALAGPVAIVLEDLHWADPATVVTLRAIGRRLGHLPIALLGTLRPSPRSDELAKLAASWREEGALYLPLAPLGPPAVTALATAITGASPAPELEDQLAAAAGNPLFLTELLGALSEDGAIAVVDGVATLAVQSLPPSLRLTILRRISSLPGPTLSLLQTATVLGTTFAPLDAATVSGRPVAAVVEAMLQARAAGVVEEAGALLRFRHDLVRRALYDDLPEAARHALHRDAGRLLAEAGAPVPQVAEQLALGAAPGDREAIRWLRDAARDAFLRAPQTAVGLLERAAALAPVGDPARDEVLAELADALVWAGRPAEGQPLAADLLARGVAGLARERAQDTVVRGLWLEARWDALVEQLDLWLQAPALPERVRGIWLADAAMAAVFGGDILRAEALGQQALEIGESLPDAVVEFQALIALGPVHNFRGRKDLELDVGERALRIAERGDIPDQFRFQPHFAVAMAFLGQDRAAEAEQMFLTGMRVREELGTVWDLPLYQAGLAELHCQVGKWDDALVEADTGLAIAEEVGTRARVAACAGVAALIHARRDDLTAATRYHEVVEREVERAGPQSRGYWAILAGAELADARGDRAAALRILQEAWAAGEHSPGLRVYLAPSLVRAALLAGHSELARDVAAAVNASGQSGRVPSSEGHALLARGAADRDPVPLARAADLFGQAGSVYELGLARELSATVTAEQGDAAAARPLFMEALDLFEGLDARRDTARALAAMRAAGLRRGSRAAHRRALKGWDALTAMEGDIVRLTVEGLTNRQIGERLFISRRTVQTHLAHAFTKLEVGSRVELAAAAQRRGDDPPPTGAAAS